MMKSNFFIQLIKQIIFVAVLFSATVVYTTPRITSFSPTSAAVGDTVTITGSGFSTTAANNIVYFGGVRATVSSATPTQLVVTVPSGAKDEPITVTANGKTGESS